MSRLTIQNISGKQASEMLDIVADVQVRGYAEAVIPGDPFESTEAFMNRFEHYRRIPGFTMVIGELDGYPVGQAFGWPLGKNSKWWTGLVLDPGQPERSEFTDETGSRTFALSEIMVDKAYQGSGYAGKLFRSLLEGRPEHRTTWLVEQGNSAYPIYRHWGARKVGELQPDWDNAPHFDVLVVDLPLTSP